MTWRDLIAWQIGLSRRVAKTARVLGNIGTWHADLTVRELRISCVKEALRVTLVRRGWLNYVVTRVKETFLLRFSQVNALALGITTDGRFTAARHLGRA